MASAFRKPKRNFRQRIVRSESDDEENGNAQENMDIDDSSKDSTDIAIRPLNIAVAKKSKDKKKDKSKNVLSFDHEEGDTDFFQVKKSSYSKKLAKQLKKESLKEREEENKKSEVETVIKQESQAPAVVKQETEEDVEDRIRRLREEFQTMNGEEAAALEEGSDDEQAGFKNLLKRGEIPDANTIHQIRKQRQQARDMGDYIPVDDTEKYEKTSSRLVREDDNDKSDDEEEGRIDFSINLQAQERIRIKNEFLAAEHGSDNEESDQEREWEEQQIRKGVSALQQVQSNPDLYSYEQQSQSAPSQQTDTYVNGYNEQSSGHTPQMKFQPFEPLTKTARESGDITMEAIIKRLKERLLSMDEVHRSHVRERDSLVTEIDETERSIQNCEESKEGLEDRFRFFQEMRGYVRDLVDCLNEKVPVINDLEARMVTLQSNRAAKFARRRQQDIRDQCQDYMTTKANVVMPSSEDQVRQRRVAEREARRARRRRARESKSIAGHHDGLSSDDEENQSEITKFSQEREEILTTRQELFEDVVEDFSEVDSVRERFLEWKKQFGETYKEAYIGLCLPKLVNPFVRLQLLDWNVLEDKCRDFEEQQWYESLMFYGFVEGEQVDRDDDDVKLLPAIVEKILLPKLSVVAEKIWDPLSTSQTCRFVNLMQKLQKDYPTVNMDSKNTRELLKSIVSRMKQTLDDDVFLPLYPKSVLENRNSGPAVFLHRQSWTCIKLLGNLLSWHGIVATKVLQGLALDGLLNRYILLGLQTAPFNQENLQKCQAVVSTFPKEWFTELPDDKTIPQLENLCRFLTFAAQLLNQTMEAAREHEKKEYRDQMKQISKLLVSIHSMDHAINLSNIYSLKV